MVKISDPWKLKTVEFVALNIRFAPIYDMMATNHEMNGFKAAISQSLKLCYTVLVKKCAMSSVHATVYCEKLYSVLCTFSKCTLSFIFIFIFTFTVD